MSFNFLGVRPGDKMEIGTQKAYRFWRYVFQPDVALLSWVASTRWYPGQRVEGTSPDVGEQGIHGFKTMDDLMFSLRNSPEGYVVRAKITQCDGIVIGEVSLWGIVWEHAKGYRAEFGQPLSFISAHGNRADEALSELRNNYINQN